jgi:polar amino acid transport system substrate-binding protein
MKAKAVMAAVLAVLIVSGFYSCKAKESGGLTIQKGVLTVGMEIGYPPMEYYGPDGKTPMGFDVDMANAIGKKMGLDIKLVDTAWDGIFAGVNTGKYDCIMSSVTINPVRQEAHNFSKPYLANTLAMVLLKGSKITARTPEECTGLDVAFQTETTSDAFMMELADEGLKFSPRRYEKVMYCFDELALGRVDVIITDLPVANEYVNKPDSLFEIVWYNPEPELFGICMKKGNDALTAAIDKVLDELFADGTMKKISQDHFEADLVTQARQ